MRKLGATIHAGLSEIGFDIGDIVRESGKMFVRLKRSGEHTGPFVSVAPTGHWIAINVMNVFRIADG